MASPTVALPNRVSAPSPMHLDTNPDASQSINATAVTPSKRKRESSHDDDDDDRQPNRARSDSTGPSAVNAASADISDSSKRNKTSAQTLRNYYLLLERCGISRPPSSHCCITTITITTTTLSSAAFHSHHRPSFLSHAFTCYTTQHNATQRKPNRSNLTLTIAPAQARSLALHSKAPASRVRPGRRASRQAP